MTGAVSLAAIAAMSSVTPPMPIPPSINAAFDCTAFERDGGQPIHLRGSATTLPERPISAIDEPVDVRFVSDHSNYPSFGTVARVSTMHRGSVWVTDERTAHRHITYDFMINETMGPPPPNGAILITEWADVGPPRYVAAGLCDVQPLGKQP